MNRKPLSQKPGGLILTNHAEIRKHERGITWRALDAAHRHGRQRLQPDGTVVCTLDIYSAYLAAKKGRDVYRWAGTVVVLSREVVVTTYLLPQEADGA